MIELFCGGGYFKEDINFTSLMVPRGLWECEPLRGGRADKEQCKNKVDKEQWNPHHSVSHTVTQHVPVSLVLYKGMCDFQNSQVTFLKDSSIPFTPKL